MSALRNDLQVVTWTWTPTGFRCDGYVGIPSPSPALVVLWPTGSVTSQIACSRIAAALAQRLAGLPGAQRAPKMPCSGGPFPLHPAKACHAYHAPGVRKLLVVIGDPALPLTSIPSVPGTWLNTSDDTFRLLAVLPVGSRPASILPQPWQYPEAAFWTGTPEEVVPDILRAAGIDETERRIFVSYVRQDSMAAADQLFDELTHRGFDVYLDRFRGQPGTDFRHRLTRELAHKAMVLLLASPGVVQSRWTLFELLFARLYGLGILAIDLSAAFSTSVIHRLPLVSSEVTRLPKAAIARRRRPVRLEKSAVSPLCDEVVAAHTQSLLARRQRLVLTVDALLRHVGAHVVATDPSGRIVATSTTAAGGRQSYSIRVSPRPAELADFHLSHAQAGGAKAVVAAPASWERGAARESLDWLETTCAIPLVEEGNWLRAARDAQRGVL
jgi:hypothetical protein